MDEAPAAPPGPKWPPRKPLLQVKAQHHAVAQLMVQGQKVIEISRRTGYSPSYVSRIQKDPVIQELLASYTRQRDQAYAYSLRRQMEILAGVDELLELRARRGHRRRQRASR
jgi:uncharacterized protein YerC